METTNRKVPIDFSNSTVNHLIEIRKWTYFFSVLGLFFMLVCVILIPVLLITSIISKTHFPLFTSVLPLIGMALIYFFPIYFLFKFSTNSKRAIESSDGQSLEVSFKFLKFHYRFMGIFVIAVIILYIILGILSSLGVGH
jgi:hypothetical protein